MTGYSTKKENTRRYLDLALVELLQEVPFHKVSVSNLTKKAGLSRGTFYLHYVDIDDFLNSQKTGLLAQFKEEFLSASDNKSFQRKITDLIYYIENHFELFKGLLGVNGDKYFEKDIIIFIQEFIFEDYELENRFPELPDQYIINLSVMSIISIILTWLEEREPRSGQEILEIIRETRQITLNELVEGKL